MSRHIYLQWMQQIGVGMSRKQHIHLQYIEVYLSGQSEYNLFHQKIRHKNNEREDRGSGMLFME